MNDVPVTRYAVLRDGRQWDEVSLAGLEVAADGALVLAGVPAADPAIDFDGPFDVEGSGVAVGACGDLFVADTDGSRVIWTDGVCGARIVLPGRGGAGGSPGEFRAPRGLLLGAAGLYVADSGNARVQVLRTPTLEPRAVWSGMFDAPTGLAGDGSERVYVLDAGWRRVLRFGAWGARDTGYEAAFGVPGAGPSPAFLAVDGDATLYVAAGPGAIRRFDADGHPLADLPTAGGPAEPGALAAHAGRLYAADRADGTIRVYDAAGALWLGRVAGYRGPVSAMVFDGDGALHVKTGGDEACDKLAANAGRVAGGTLTAGPLDAGEQSGWFRLRVEAEQPADGTLKLETFVSNDAGAAPVWTAQEALDVLLPQLPAPDQPGLKEVFPTRHPEPDRLEPQRYLWLRVTAAGGQGSSTPRVLQVQAETPGEDYMEYMPGVYRRKDSAGEGEVGFLRRWLALFRAELSDLEHDLDALPRRFNAATAPADGLPWLAGWLAFDPPAGVDPATLRTLLGRAIELHRRRGTPAGVREFVQLHTGIRPLVIESFRERRVWMLGHTSRLGFDTALASVEPHGAVLPDPGVLCGQGCDPTAPPPDGLVVGSFVVGGSGPLASDDFGAPLFGDGAHHFSVFVSAAEVRDPARREALRRVLEAERPAHADYDLCLVEPRMRVGLQATLGVDSYVAGPPAPMALSGTVLGLDSYLGAEPGEGGASRVGREARLGTETILE